MFCALRKKNVVEDHCRLVGLRSALCCNGRPLSRSELSSSRVTWRDGYPARTGPFRHQSTLRVFVPWFQHQLYTYTHTLTPGGGAIYAEGTSRAESSERGRDPAPTNLGHAITTFRTYVV